MIPFNVQNSLLSVAYFARNVSVFFFLPSSAHWNLLKKLEFINWVDSFILHCSLRLRKFLTLNLC